MPWKQLKGPLLWEPTILPKERFGSYKGVEGGRDGAQELSCRGVLRVLGEGGQSDEQAWLAPYDWGQRGAVASPTCCGHSPPAVCSLPHGAKRVQLLAILNGEQRHETWGQTQPFSTAPLTCWGPERKSPGPSLPGSLFSTHHVSQISSQQVKG